MPHLTVTHTTHYAYHRPVGLLRHRLMMRPRDSHDLRLHAATLDIQPAPASTRWAHDIFGNSICLLDWADSTRTDNLRIVSGLDLTHYPSGPTHPHATLDPIAEALPFDYREEEAADVASLTALQHPKTGDVVGAWAQDFVRAIPGAGTLAVLETMTHAIHDKFVYRTREEEGTQPAAETLALGSGTCRDFALLMMEACRSLGLAARFVSGYLYRGEGGELQGGGATHAWCAIYLPGAGWVEYDPTNGLIAGSNLIRVVVARSPAQAVPVGGGFVGDAGDLLSLAVDVTVRVTLDEATANAA